VIQNGQPGPLAGIDESRPIPSHQAWNCASSRDDLLRLDGDVSVTNVALRYGFSHLGRFSSYYQSAFGEAPSVTLRRGRYSGRRKQRRAPRIDRGPELARLCHALLKPNVRFCRPRAALPAKSQFVKILWGERRGPGTMGAVQRLPMELPDVATFSF